MPARIVILASGAGSLAQSLIVACAEHRIAASVVALGSDVPDAPVLAKAAAAGVPTFVREPHDFGLRADWDRALLEEVRRREPDLVVSAGFMRLLGRDFVDSYPARIVNSHPSLLPAFPGTHAVRDALAAGVAVTGCTVHLVDHGMDTGPILAQREVDVLPDDDEETLHERIKVVERDLLVETVGTLTARAASTIGDSG